MLLEPNHGVQTAPVMMHGDLWNNNFIFERVKGKDGAPDHHGDQLIAFIDFQVHSLLLPDCPCDVVRAV